MRIRLFTALIAVASVSLWMGGSMPMAPAPAVAAPSAASAACPPTPNYTSFTDASCLQLNGGPVLTGGALQLNDGAGNEARSAFYTQPIGVNAAWSTRFTINLTPVPGSTPGDGVTFVVQNDPAGASALGGSGGGLGYSSCAVTLPSTPQCSGMSPSLAVEFDPYNNPQFNDPYSGAGQNSNAACQHVGILENGDVSNELSYYCLTSSSPVASLTSGPVPVEVDYRPAQSGTGTLSVNLNGTTVLRQQVNLASLLNSSTAYLGFTGGTGVFSEVQSINNWAFNYAVGPNLVTNGSFESPTYTAGNWAWVPSIPGWTPCGASQNIEIGNAWEGTAQDGSQYTELNSDQPGAVCQTINTVPGSTYQLSFWFSPRPGVPLTYNQMDVKWGGTDLTPTAISADGSTLSTTNWSEYVYTVTASSTSTTIDFADVGAASFSGCACGDLLDNVQVNSILTSPLPPPTFSPGENGAATWGGTAANPVAIRGTAVPGASVALYGGGTCGGTAVGSATADSSGNWSISISNLTSEGSYAYSAAATYAGTLVSACSTSIAITVDRTPATSTITSPGIGTNAVYVNANAWSAGCGSPAIVGICGTATDGSGSGVAAVYVAIEKSDGTFWNGTSFNSSGAWLQANGTTSWSLAMPQPPEGVYTVASAAIDYTGNTQAIFSMSIAGICDPTSTGGTLPLNGGTLSLNGGLCTVRDNAGHSGTLSLNGGTLSLNGGTLPLNGGTLSLNGGTLPLNGGSCAVKDNSGNAGTVLVTGGTLVSSRGTLSLNGGTLSLNGGTLSLNGGTFSLTGGTLPLNGGTLPLNGGQCSFTASGSSGTLSMNGGTLSMNGGTLSMNGGTLSINGGTLPLNGGTLSLNGGTLSVNGGAGGNAGNVVIDTTPPYVSFFSVDGQQGSGAANINPSATFHIHFDESVLPSSVNGSTITVSATNGTTVTAVPVTPACDPTCLDVSFSGFQPSTVYTVTVSGVRDLAGNALAGTSTNPNTFTFTTAAAPPLTGSAASDTDGDNIPDGWDGTTTPTFSFNGQPTNTAAWGFTPQHKDLCLVENYMAGTAANGTYYDQHISQAANQAIVNAFANAPVTNPDGTLGVHLVIFEGPLYSAGLPSTYTGPYFGGQISMTDPLGDASTGALNWGAVASGTTQSFDSIRTTNFVPTGLSQFCHYAVIAHNLGGTGSSGASRGIGSSDLVIALGGTVKGAGIGTQSEQQGTVMHELGHNLGLHHGGGPGIPDLDLNYKPNYMSVMNYFYQFEGIPGGFTANGLDYSHGTTTTTTLPFLDESALNDSIGLGPGAVVSGGVFGTRFFCPGSTTPSVVADASQPINWGCNSSGPASGTISADVNGDGSLEQMHDYNDWAHLVFAGGDIGMGTVPPPPATTTIDISGGMGSGGANTAPAIESKSVATFAWTGFFSPLSSDTAGKVVNAGKVGRTYPVKFQLQDASGKYVSTLSAVRSITFSQSAACTGGTTDAIAYSTTSTSGLHYDTTANQFIYNWATPSTAGCYMLNVSLSDGTSYLSLFSLS